MKSPTHISRAASFRRLRLTLLLVAMVMMASGVSAQVRRQIPRPIQKPIKNKNDRQPRGPAAPPVLISVSASIENLLRKADEGIDRRQWKLTIDSLQRVIESPERSLVPADDDGRFESIRNVALRKLSTLPPEAMSAYHLLYDGKARAMFDRARQGHDIDLLQSVVDRYLLTAVGGEASSLLAGWLLDEGKAADALRIVEDLEQFGGVSGLPARSLVKKAAALALTGRSDDARAVFDRISDDDQDLSGDGLSGDSDAFLASLSVALRWRQSRLVQSDNPDGWPVVAGDNARRSLMPPVNPTVSGGIPWRFVLGGTTDFEWRPLVTDDPMGPLVQPPGNIVIDGDLLFLRTPSRLVALDAATLQQVWSRPFPAREYRVDPTNQPRQVGQVSRIAYDRDFAAWAVAAHDGKVFVLQRHMQRSDGIRRSSIQNYRHFPAWLCAFEQSTGRRLWQVGRLEEFPHPLADVEIRSAPIWAEGQLWFTYQRQRDLYLASVRASDGQINRSILLCSLPSPATPSWLPLDPAYDDGTVYVPTGEGMLLAVRTRDGNLLWATKYGESVTPTNAPPPIRPASRLVSAPVIADGLVLLAPTERNELFAFTADGGDIQWRVPLEGASYIVGATDSEVYLGGRTLCSLSLLDGSQKWSRPVEGAPTARTVLSGPHLLTPTWEEFVVTRAADGEVLSSQVLPSGQPPLGRLLCIKNAMYSVDPNLVRKFPDVERAYPETLARFEAAPDDANLATRLAWMELLKKSPERAYRVVRDFKVPDGVDPEARVALDRVRVSSLMSMADGADPTDRGALSWLEEAERYASTAQERVRVQLAFADRLRSLGDVTDAYQKLVQLGTAPDSRDVALRDGLTSYAVRLDVSSRLASLETVLREDQRQGLIDLLDARFATLSGKLRDNNDSQQAVAELDGLIHLDLLGETTIDALFELADLRMDQQRFEQAEQLLREALRRAETDQTRIRCLLRLYESVAGVSEFPGPAHEKSLSYLTSTYGKASIEDLGDMIVEDWVASERDRIKDLYGLNDSQRTALGPGFDGSVAWSPIQSRRSVRRVGRTTTANRPWTGTANTDGVILFSGPEDAVLDDRVVLINEEDTVQCIHAGNGAVLWESQLGFPSIEEAEPIVELQSVNDAGLPVTAVVDGQTAVIRGASGLHALGLVSGKRIWSMPYIGYQRFPSGYRESIALAAGPGWVVGTPRGGRLTLLRTLDGTQVWERDLRGEQITRVEVHGDRIVAFDNEMQRVHVVDPKDGRLVKRVLFHQPDRQGALVDIRVSGGVVCGPVRSRSGSEGVAAYSLDDGRLLWEEWIDKPLTQVFVPAEGMFGLGDLSGRLKLVRAESGESTLEVQNRTIQRVNEATLHDGILLIRHENPAFRSIALVALDASTGEQMWVRGGLASLRVARRPLDVVDGRMISVADQRSSRGRIEPLKAMFVDVVTGEQVGDSVDLMYSPKKSWRQVVYRRFPGMILFGTPDNVMPFIFGQ